jgi:hypothetical protein
VVNGKDVLDAKGCLRWSKVGRCTLLGTAVVNGKGAPDAKGCLRCAKVG